MHMFSQILSFLGRKLARPIQADWRLNLKPWTLNFVLHCAKSTTWGNISWWYTVRGNTSKGLTNSILREMQLRLEQWFNQLHSYDKVNRHNGWYGEYMVSADWFTQVATHIKARWNEFLFIVDYLPLWWSWHLARDLSLRTPFYVLFIY